MNIGIVEVAKFTGQVAAADENVSTTYLVAVNGVYPTKYGDPNFMRLPKDWINQYKVKEFRISFSNDWKSFFSKCKNKVNSESIFTEITSKSSIVKFIESNIDDSKSSPNDKVDVEDILDKIISET